MTKNQLNKLLWSCLVLIGMMPVNGQAKIQSTSNQSNVQVNSGIKKAQSTAYDNATANVTWAFTGSATDAATETPDDAFTLSSFSYGSKLSVASSSTYNNVTYTRFQPTVQATAASADNEMVFKVTPAKGITFTPTKVSALICRFGTDGGTIDVSARNDDGKTVTLGSGVIPARNKTGSNGVASFEYTVDNTLATSKGFELVVSLYGLGNTKQFGISNVQIDGTVNGTKEEVAQYTISTNVNPTEAGTVSVSPTGTTFDAGTALTATATKNFGYKFTNWTDAEGNVVSQDNNYAFTLNANTTLTANFAAVKTYALNLTAASPANSYMVQASPAATVVNGKNMYEDGTAVTLTASSNPILTFTGWSDGVTTKEKTVNMTEDVTLTANYAAVDYIAGWDFYKSGNNGRIADFYATGNDADQLILRNADGTNVAWLDRSQVSTGGYEGKPAAINWRNDAAIGTYYWQVQVNATNFTDIKVSADMLYSYNGYQNQDVEYSLDNSTWTKLGTISISSVKSWTNGTFTLPAAANNQSAVYIRWKSDTTSKLDGTTSINDGITISNIFVTGTSSKTQSIPSTLDPTLATVSSSDANAGWNSTNFTKMANGSTVTFRVSNTTAQKYTLAFDAAAENAATSVSVAVTDASNTSIVSKTININQNGADSYVTYRASIPELAAGNYTIVLTTNVTGSGYSANLKNLVVTKDNSADITLDETSDSYSASGYYENVTLNRTLNSANWNTFCVPFSMDIPSGWTVKQLTDATKDANGNITLVFGDAKSITAGQPYMVKCTSDYAGSYSLTNATLSTSPTAQSFSDVVTFTGNYAKQYVPQGSYFIHNNIYYCADQANTVNLNGFRAYLTPASSGNAATINYMIDGQVVTSIGNIQKENVKDKSTIYNLNGCRVSAPTKGLYIMNGKKVIY